MVVRGDGASGVEWRHALSLAPARDDDLPALDPAAAMVVMYTSGTYAAVADVAIVAMPSRETGEKRCAFVVLRPGQTIDLADIRRFLERAGLARQKFPEHLVTVDELPRVPSGKVSKDVLRTRVKAIAEAGEPARRLDGTR